MIKTLDNGLKLLPSSDGIDSFLFDSSKIELSIDYVKTNNIKRVMLNPFHGFAANDLKSIMPIKNIVEELIIGTEKLNYNGLEEFHNLKLLGVPDNKKDIVDLNNYPYLVTLNCSITNRLIGLENCIRLKKLTISDYKTETKDLSALPPLNNLEHLSLIKTDITTMQGIERFSNLKILEIFSASKLETIAPLQALSNSLKEIQVEQCKKIKDFEILGKVQSLKKIILSESGEIKSLAFVEELPQLEFISFWGTNVLDGNIKYCEGINYVGFDNKKHYTNKSEQFKK
jgi:hypothetical protein